MPTYAVKITFHVLLNMEKLTQVYSIKPLLPNLR